MSSIPQARRRLMVVTERLQAMNLELLALRSEVVEIVGTMRRAPPTRKKTRPKSTPMSPALAESIRVFAYAHPAMSHQEIGDCFSVNTGRVSEAIAGLR